MIRFKKYILNEGISAARRDFVKTGKIDEFDLKAMVSLLKENGDEKAKLVEWLARWWVVNRDNERISMVNPNFIKFKTATKPKKDFELLKEFVAKFVELREARVLTTDPPKDLMPDKLLSWIKEKGQVYYSKKRMDIPSKVKAGTDYEEVYVKDGMQVWKLMTHEGAMGLGGGTKWCITGQDGKEWKNYNFRQNLRFYVIRNHLLSSSNPRYKLAVVVNMNKIHSIWDAKDTSLTHMEDVIKELGISLKLFKWHEIEYTGYTKEQLKELDGDFKRVVSDLIGWSHRDFKKRELEYAKEDDRFEEFVKDWHDYERHDDSEEGKEWVAYNKKYLKDPLGYLESIGENDFAAEYFANMYELEEVGIVDELYDFYLEIMHDDISDLTMAIEEAIIDGNDSSIKYFKPSDMYREG